MPPILPILIKFPNSLSGTSVFEKVRGEKTRDSLLEIWLGGPVGRFSSCRLSLAAISLIFVCLFFLIELPLG